MCYCVWCGEVIQSIAVNVGSSLLHQACAEEMTTADDDYDVAAAHDAVLADDDLYPTRGVGRRAVLHRKSLHHNALQLFWNYLLT